MYGKIFAQIYDGSLFGHWQALVTFQQMLVLAEQDGTIEMTPEALAARTSIPLDIIRVGIEELERPDPDSRTPKKEGRRIVRLSEHRSWGWQITNYEEYNKLRSAEERREYMRQYQRDRRSDSKPPSTSVNNGQHPLAPSTPIDIDVAVDVAGTNSDGFETFWSAYPKRAGGNPKKDAHRCWGARLKEGHAADIMVAGAVRYGSFIFVTGKSNTEFVMQAKRFLGPSLPFLETWDAPATNGNHPQQFEYGNPTAEPPEWAR